MNRKQPRHTQMRNFRLVSSTESNHAITNATQMH